MELRQLMPKDATRMLEWMHNSDVVMHLQTDFLNKTIDDCESFIANSTTSENINLAIAVDDLYMGTVSLKHIDSNSAEFAITICADAMGKGYSAWAMREILKKGFMDLNLKYIYWCVSPENKRAVRFYDKNGYRRVMPDEIDAHLEYEPQQISDYIWYVCSNPVADL